MLKKTITAATIGTGSLLAVAAPAAADPAPSSSVEQIGLINLNNVGNNLCILPWADGQVLAFKIPLGNPQEYQACDDGSVTQD